MKNFRRIMALALVLCLALTLAPASVLAADEETETITRVEWLQKLVALFEMSVEEENYPDNYFSDIDAESEYYHDVMLAAEFGLLDVEAGEAVEPEAATSREFAAHTLNLCLGFLPDTDCTFADADALLYPDDDQIAVERGWLTLNDGNFDPDSPITATEAETMLADAADVLAADEQDDLESSFQFADYVIDLPETVQFSSDEGTVTIYNCPQTLGAGDTFALWYDGAPYVYYAESVTVSGSNTIVVTGDFDYSDAVPEYQYSGTTELDLSSFEAAEDVEFVYVEDQASAVAAAALFEDAGIIANSVDLDIVNGSLVGIKTIEVGDLSLTFGFTISNLALNKAGQGEYARVELTGDLDMYFTGGITFTDSVTLGYVSEGPFSIKLTLDLDLSGTITLDYQGYISVGVAYNNGDYRLLYGFRKKESSLTLETKFDAGIRLSVNANFHILSASAYAKMGVKSTTKSQTFSEGTPHNCTTISAYLYATIGAKASVNLIDVYKKSWDKKYDIYTASNSPVRVYYHYEDDQQVSACTRGSSGNSAYTRYTTSASSRYGSSSYGSASSTGTGSNGSTYTIYTYEENDTGITITGYNGNVSALSIPSKIDGCTVTAIGSGAFQNNTTLKTVIIPDTVTEIGGSAFAGCTNLKSVQFSKNLTLIDDSAFEDCTALTSVELPEGLVELGAFAFHSCTALEKVYIPSTLETSNYWDGAFRDCSVLNTVEFGNGIPVISTGLFQGCTGLTEIVIPDSVTEIQGRAFESCTSLKTVTIPDSVTSYGSYVFTDCTALESIRLSQNALTIPEDTFSGCSVLDNVVIPEGVTEIQSRTFYSCASLKSIDLPETVTAIGGSAFAGTSFTDLSMLPGSIETIDGSAFSGCTALVSAALPDRIKTLSGSTFQNCTALTAFEGGLDLQTIGSNAFQGCTALTDVTLHDGLTTVSGYAFQGCTALEKIVLPDTVTSLGTYAFQKCTALTDVTLSAGLLTIPQYAFANDVALAAIVIPDGVQTIDSYAFYQDTALLEIALPASLTSISATSALSYPTKMTVYGWPDSYAESWADEKNVSAFVDVSVPATAISLANGTNAMTLVRGTTVTPGFALAPSGCNECFVLTSGDTSVVQVKNNVQLYGAKDGSAVITATGSSGQTYTFTVTVKTLSSIAVISLPDNTEYAPGAMPDYSGLTVLAVYSDNSSETVDGFTVTGYSRTIEGEQTLTVTFGGRTTVFVVPSEASAEPASPTTPGDLNGDGEVNASDLTILARHVGKVETMEDETALANADVTGDGSVDASDLTKLAQYVGKIISSLD